MTALCQTSEGQLCVGTGNRHVKVSSYLGKLGLFLSRFTTEFRRARLFRQEVATLERLSDHTLYDIGVPRSRIPDVARANVERYLTEKLEARAAGGSENGR